MMKYRPGGCAKMLRLFAQEDPRIKRVVIVLLLFASLTGCAASDGAQDPDEATPNGVSPSSPATTTPTATPSDPPAVSAEEFPCVPLNFGPRGGEGIPSVEERISSGAWRERADPPGIRMATVLLNVGDIDCVSFGAYSHTQTHHENYTLVLEVPANFRVLSGNLSLAGLSSGRSIEGEVRIQAIASGEAQVHAHGQAGARENTEGRAYPYLYRVT